MKNILTVLVTLVSFLGYSQSDYFRYDQINVINENGDTIRNPFAGGFNAPQFSEIDLNFDGIKDLFVFDRDGGVIKTFINGGTPNEVDYTYSHDYWQYFPPLRNFALLVDYNCDGKEDIFTGATGGMTVYKNTSNPVDGIQFEAVTGPLSNPQLIASNYGGSGGLLNLYVPSTDIPAILDVDNDGDIDVLTFGVWGSFIEYHKNLSMDSLGNCDSLMFMAETTCWGNFSENSTTNGVTFGLSCKGLAGHDPDSLYENRHAGSTILALDTDDDGDKEVLLGDVSYPNMVAVFNGGDSLAANMTSQDTAFPSYNTQVDLYIFPAGYYVDVNNDGAKDLIVAPNAANISENFTSTWYYENLGTTTLPDFNLVQDDFLQEEMIEVGMGANAVFEDVDQDGLTDLIVGNYGYFGLTDFSSKIAWYRNVGTITNPVFKLEDRDYGGFSAIGDLALWPTFGDLDSDGDNDLIIGNYNGDLYYYQNTAGQGNPYTYNLSAANYKAIDVGNNSAPQLFDLNGDNLLDLIIGEKAGNINYYTNIGSPTVANFSSTPTTSELGGIDVMIPCCTGYSSAHMTRDFNNDLIFYVGSEDGVIYIYSDIDTQYPDTAYTLTDSIVTGAKSVNPFTADINNSGKYEIVYAENAGGLSILHFNANVTLVSPLDGSTGVPYDLILDWTAAPEVATFYEYNIDTVNTFDSPELIAGQTTYASSEDNDPDSKVFIPSLTLTETYFWRVRYLTSSDTSDWTDTWQFTVTEDSVTIADFVADETVVDTGTVVTFTDLSSSNPTAWLWTFENGVPETSTAQNPQVLYANEGEFDVTLIATNAFGIDTITKTEYITVQIPPNSVIDLFSKEHVSLYPNPAGESITIQFTELPTGNISIVDINGKMISSLKQAQIQNEINISELSAGVYFIRYNSEEIIRFYKFVKL